MSVNSPPFLRQNNSIRRIMGQVLLALLPGIAIQVWLIGPLVLVQLSIATLTALAAEAAMLRLREKPLILFLGDGSAIVTAWLIALCLPPLAPGWLIVIGTLFALVVAKHLYGGLGQNPLNPAMTAFAVCIVSLPTGMLQGPSIAPQLSVQEQLAVIFSNIAGHSGEWVGIAYCLGGLWLWQRKIIGWRTPFSFLVGMMLPAILLYRLDSSQYANPLFHLFSGQTLLGAFFIVTEPVTGCTTPKGKLIFGFSAGLLAYLIRVFGGYPDGLAFAVLILNRCVPLIDLYTQPPIFGMKKP